MNRREFLSVWAGAAAYGAVRPGNGRALVVLQMAGGNDGLNTVVPYEDDSYARARTTLRLTAKDVRKIGGALGFHQELGGLERLLGQGKLAVVQGVGYPNMNRDHNAGMRHWQTARPTDADEQTGWLGRYADRHSDSNTGNVPAVFVGQPPRPLTVHAREAIVPSLTAPAEWTLRGPLSGYASARATARSVEAAIKAEAGGGAYPQHALGQSLRSVAQLLRSETGASVYLVEHGGVSPGGYDNHSNQAGHHAVLLRELSDAIMAFCADLTSDGLLDRVLLMTYSEFGRNITENGRHGTNHGAAAPVFLAGGKVKPGVHGAHPSLSDVEGDAPKAHTDFRAVYATALEGWLGVPAEPILGERFTPLKIVG